MHMLNCGYNGTCVDLSLVSDARGSDGRVISLKSCLVCTGSGNLHQNPLKSARET